jgi:hypothetical protein
MMMTKLFNRGWSAVTVTTDIVTDTVEPSRLHDPLPSLPKHNPEPSPSIGIDCNLPLLVKDIGSLKLTDLTHRKQKITKELVEIDLEITQLQKLLDVVNNL